MCAFPGQLEKVIVDHETGFPRCSGDHLTHVAGGELCHPSATAANNGVAVSSLSGGERLTVRAVVYSAQHSGFGQDVEGPVDSGEPDLGATATRGFVDLEGIDADVCRGDHREDRCPLRCHSEPALGERAHQFGSVDAHPMEVKIIFIATEVTTRRPYAETRAAKKSKRAGVSRHRPVRERVISGPTS